ncbi:chondroitinase-B domain-containing protein [Rheinheimera fenheensis]|uniref:chondroitinase-B domain-containing protein n=1 Tax=Rheinheimera fenheensis TaxID=3152295 RepID=UPI00325EDBED
MNNCFTMSIICLAFLLSGCTDSDEETVVSPDIPAIADFGRQEVEYPLFDYSTCDQQEIFCVSSKSEWEAAISARPGVIVIKPGIYDFGYTLIDFPSKFYSSELWQAELVGDTYFKVVSSDVSFSGFKFVRGASPSGGLYPSERHGVFWLEGNSLSVENNYFLSIGKDSTVPDRTGITIHVVNSENVEIYNNVFIDSQAIAIKTSDSSKYINVFNNDFLDSYDFGGAGEVVHFGDAFTVSQGVSPRDDNSYSKFYSNFVSNWNLEKELVSIKSNNNEIIGNYIQNVGEAAIVVRMGNFNKIAGNYVIGNSEFPFRLSGERNVIVGNTLCGSGVAVSFHAEMVYVEQLPNLYNSYWAAKNNLISNNLFYGYSGLGIIDEGYAADADFLQSLPDGNEFAENVFYYKGDFKKELEGVAENNNTFKNFETNCILIE